MGKVCCNFEQNQTKVVKVTKQKHISNVLSVIIQHLIIRITEWHNSCNTDSSAPIFLSNMHCLMVKMWCKFERNRTKTIEVIEQKT